MIKTLQNIAIEAGKAILEIYNSEDFNVEIKGDGSPLTRADKAANEVIVAGLKQHYPTIPILSEEGRDIPYEERKNWTKFFLVDPLDGTKEFIKRNGEFTVNIALIENGTPIAGVVYAPVLGMLYACSLDTASGDWQLATSSELTTSDWQLVPRNQHPEASTQKLEANSKHPAADNPYKIVASRSHLSPETEQFVDQMRQQHGEVELVSMGSSLKICLVAEGKADVYPRLGPTMEWDTAAAHAIALAAGCEVIEFESNKPLIYNKENLLNPFFLVRRSGS